MTNTPNNNATPGPSTPRFSYHVPMNYLSGSQPYGGWAVPTMSYSFATPTTSASYMYNPYAAPAPAPVPVKKEAIEQDAPLASIPPPSAAPVTQDPLPAFTPNWDSALKTFLEDVGMSEALNGLERDMLVMNSAWERTKVPPALKRLIENVKALVTDQPDNVFSEHQATPLEERKLDYVHPANGTTPLPPSTITKSISQFLAKNRARNDASNRAEFLLSLEEKRARRGDAMDVDDEPSCARTDAKQVDRTQQIKYDVAKNDDHLRRTTMKKQLDSQPLPSQKGKEKVGVVEQTPYTEFDERMTAERHPGLDERLSNVEAHFSVHYVPSPPLSLLARLKLLEDHIIQLEKEYPPWAALHFNQPNRDWPPPPPSTALIVPTHVQKISKPKIVRPSASADVAQYSSNRNQSSLHKAVMDRLEVQRITKGKTPG